MHSYSQTLQRDIDSELVDIITNYEQRLEEDQENRTKEVVQPENPLIVDFRRICVEIIKPAMAEIGIKIEPMGYPYHIVENEKTYDSEGGVESLNIKLMVFPRKRSIIKYPTAKYQYPYVTYRGFKSITNIAVNMSITMPGTEGYTKQSYFRREDATRNFVMKQLLIFIKECFSNPPTC